MPLVVAVACKLVASKINRNHDKATTMIFSLVLTSLLLGIAAHAYAAKLLQAKKIKIDQGINHNFSKK
jgi:hypothetical protein